MLDKDNVSLSRVSRDGRKSIVRSGDKYYVLSTEDNSIVDTSSSLTPIVASGSWRRTTSEEEENFEVPDLVAVEDEAGDVYEFNEEYDFFATPYDVDQGEDFVTGIYALDPETGEMFWWENGAFEPVSEQDLDPSLPETWILIDNKTAEYVADWQDHRVDDEPYCPLHGADPGEKAMFDSVEAAVDWGFIKELSAVVADASGYSPAERSQNASKQRRGPGGRFAAQPGSPDSRAAPAQTSAPQVLKTYIPAKRELKLIPNPLNFIVDFIKGANPVTAPGAVGAPVVASGDAEKFVSEQEQIVSPEAQKATREPAKAESSDTLYFAIVDKNDQRAVHSIIAITKDESGKPQAWNRNMGEWKPSPDALADMQSITPPPVIQLEEADVEEVVAGIDAYDKENPQAATADSDGIPDSDAEKAQRAAQASIVEDVVRGYALEDGSFRIKTVADVFSAVQAAPEDASDAVKAHIVKRARAFNRMDIVPQEWRSVTSLNQAPLFNSYGEVIIAAGNRGGNEETLKEYWRDGAGAAKIRWNSDGDMTRCIKYLTKYLKDDAPGFCQNLHMQKFGKSNYKKDNGE